MSRSVSHIYADCVGKLGLNSNPMSAFKKAMIQVVGERDFGAQETAHILQSLPLYSCTFNFVTLSLDGGRQVRKDTQTPEDIAAQLKYIKYLIVDEVSMLGQNMMEKLSFNQ